MKVIKTVGKILIGVILILAAIYLYLPKDLFTIWFLSVGRGWYQDLLVLIKGSLGLVIALIGLVLIALAKE